jgi:hypothetical protein
VEQTRSARLHGKRARGDHHILGLFTFTLTGANLLRRSDQIMEGWATQSHRRGLNLMPETASLWPGNPIINFTGLDIIIPPVEGLVTPTQSRIGCPVSPWYQYIHARELKAV